MKHPASVPDPSILLAYRDSMYATDLLLCAIAHFDIFTYLAKGPRRLKDICSDLKIKERPADVLITLLLARGLVTQSTRGFRTTPIAQTFFSSKTPYSLIPYYNSLKSRPQCSNFYEILKTGRPANWPTVKSGKDWTAAMSDAQFARSFMHTMDSRGAYLSEKLAAALDTRGYTTLLDIAGGSGVYACALAQAHAHLGVSVLEVSPVDSAARESIANKHMSDSVSVVPGDMFSRIPTGYDMHLFANTFHDWNLKAVRTLISRSYFSLNRDGMIVVFDTHLNEHKDGPLPVAEYSCLLMYSTEGRCYASTEITAMLEEQGFRDVRETGIAAHRTMITARKT